MEWCSKGLCNTTSTICFCLSKNSGCIETNSGLQLLLVTFCIKSFTYSHIYEAQILMNQYFSSSKFKAGSPLCRVPHLVWWLQNTSSRSLLYFLTSLGKPQLCLVIFPSMFLFDCHYLKQFSWEQSFLRENELTFSRGFNFAMFPHST